VVSNRTAAPGEARAGGLAVAISDALRETGGLWFGWSGTLSETVHPAPRMIGEDGVDFALTDLTPAEYEGYYLGYANRVLWPLFHYRTDLAETGGSAFAVYEAVNRRFARQLSPLLRPGDIVWVHDYHLIPVGRELRAAGWRGATGFFLHTPFPAPEVFSALPQHARLARALCDYDLVGFQTRQDAENFRTYLSHRARAQPFREPAVAAFPVGIDPGEIDIMLRTRAARDAEAGVRSALAGEALVLGVDRMDYSKGLPQRLRGFERLLQVSPEHRRRVSLVQVASPSRMDIAPYREVAAESERIAARINGAFGELSWTPVRHISRCYPREVLCGLFRAARVGLVTPLRDGMNLVAKEFVAAQDPADPGVLVLSRFAGAAAQLDAALMVNPHDPDGIAAAIRRALAMPLDERVRRWRALNEVVRAEDIGWWRRRFLGALERVRPSATPRRVRTGLEPAV
jgi:trehalose 6-phosphate synthase